MDKGPEFNLQHPPPKRKTITACSHLNAEAKKVNLKETENRTVVTRAWKGCGAAGMDRVWLMGSGMQLIGEKTPHVLKHTGQLY